MPILRRLFRQGNSTVVALPSYLLQLLDLQPGDRVICDIQDKKAILISPEPRPARPDDHT